MKTNCKSYLAINGHSTESCCMWHMGHGAVPVTNALQVRAENRHGHTVVLALQQLIVVGVEHSQGDLKDDTRPVVEETVHDVDGTLERHDTRVNGKWGEKNVFQDMYRNQSEDDESMLIETSSWRSINLWGKHMQTHSGARETNATISPDEYGQKPWQRDHA